MKVVNLTPHRLTIAGEVFEPSGAVCRVDVQYEDIGEVAGLPLTAAKYGKVTGLPAPEKGKIFVVSGIVESALAANRSRDDVFAVGELIRDEEGRVVACRGLKITAY